MGHKFHPVAARYYLVHEIMAHFFADEYAAALAASDEEDSMFAPSNVQIEQFDYHYHAALAAAAFIGDAPEPERKELHARLRAHDESLRAWEGQAAFPGFANKLMLVAAEVARIEGKELEAQRLYEDSIRLARLHGFVQDEADGNAVASRYYASRGLDRIAGLLLREAHSCYARSGALAKILQLEAAYPQLRDNVPISEADRRIAPPADQFDLATVIRVAQSVSGEIVLEKLLDTLLRTAIEHAGARRVVLLLACGAERHVEAVGLMTDAGVMVRLRGESDAGASIPETVVQHVLQTRESVILDKSIGDSVFSSDPYIRENHVQSLLALPLINRGMIVGLLYFDNDLASGVFTPSRIPLLKLIASHAAIALENTRLYRGLEEREAKIRRLVDANIIGVFMWKVDGRIVEANDSFLDLVGYGRGELGNGNLKWTTLIPPESWDETMEDLQEVTTMGTMRPAERMLSHKDGRRIPILIGAAAFANVESEGGVAYVLDLTGRRDAEEAARTNARRYRELQSELAHANRVATVGQLSAAISHDVRQPLVGVVTSGSAGLNWLAMDPPNISAAQRALKRAISEGHRAAEVLERTRALVKKLPPKCEMVSINRIISETVGLVSGEAAQKGVRLRLALGTRMPPIMADRVQMQQVILNLIMNAIEAMSEVTDAQRDLDLVCSVDHARRIRVQVRDTGPGVPADALTRLFDSFYSTKADGMGMGLPISRTIVETHGGEIGVEKNAPRGAVFWFSLPVAEVEAAAGTDRSTLFPVDRRRG